MPSYKQKITKLLNQNVCDKNETFHKCLIPCITNYLGCPGCGNETECDMISKFCTGEEKKEQLLRCKINTTKIIGYRERNDNGEIAFNRTNNFFAPKMMLGVCYTDKTYIEFKQGMDSKKEEVMWQLKIANMILYDNQYRKWFYVKDCIRNKDRLLIKLSLYSDVYTPTKIIKRNTQTK